MLTGYQPEDINAIFENFSKNEIKKILGHRSEEEYEKEEYKNKKGYASYNRSFLLFLITVKPENTIIGRCGLHNWNMDHNRAELGYNMTDENYKRKGFMTEAVGAVLDFGFKQLKLHRVEALIGSNNIPSLKIAENYHFTKEGLLRQHYYASDNYEDSFVFSLLEQEYLGRK